MQQVRNARRFAFLGVALLAAALLLAGCAGGEEEHDHSTHSHDDEESGGMAMADGGHAIDHGAIAAIQAAQGMSVALRIEPDAVDGVNITVLPAGFTFAPQHVNSDHIPGEGHAHLYVDGVKVTRLYGPHYHLAGLAPGEHEIRVTLNANTHAAYAHGDRPVETAQMVTIAEGEHAHGAGMDDGPVEAPEGMTVALHAEADAPGGAVNIRIDAEGFTFTPERVNGDHAAGEGHADVYVDGEKIGRVYGPYFHLGGLASGEHEIRVTLNANTHAAYARGGEPLEAVARVTVP